MTPDTEGTAEAERRSAAHGALIEQDLPALLRAGGWETISTLRETSCLGDPDPAVAASRTKWLGSGSADLPAAEARQRAERVGARARELGWTPQEGSGPHGDRLFGATKEELTLVVSYETGGGHRTLTVAVHSPCLEMPEGHTMTRSGLDALYGSADPLYPDEDRSAFTNGSPKPLPE